MRNLSRRLAAALGALQGIAGVGCVAAGAYLLAGVGVALVVFGGFLLLGAFASSRTGESR